MTAVLAAPGPPGGAFAGTGAGRRPCNPAHPNQLLKYRETFTVPLQALDGYVEVCTVGGCDQTAFTTGSSSFSSPLSYSRPDIADLDLFGGHPMWMKRIIVSYTGNVESTDAAAVMDDAVTPLVGTTIGYDMGML